MFLLLGRRMDKLNSKAKTIVNETYLVYNTDFHNLQDGIYSFNINASISAPEEYKQPPRNIGDGIIIIKTYAVYQTICCIGINGIAISQKNIKTNTLTAWKTYL